MIDLLWIRSLHNPLPAIRKFSIYGLALVVSHSVLFCSIVFRTLATVYSGLDITINASILYYVLYYALEHILGFDLIFDLGFDEGENITKPSHICCVGVWLSVTFIACCLIIEIIMNDLLRMVYHKLSVCSFGSVLKVGILLATILHYEVWMFSYIYYTYVTTFDWLFKLIIICPFFTLLLHTSLQMVSLSYGECKHDETRKTYFGASLFFNIIMVVHVFCMAITSYFRDFQEIDNVPLIGLIFIAAVEVCYRCYAIKEYYYLYLVQQHPSGQDESTAFGPNNPSSELVTGGTLWATGGSFSYFAIVLCLCVSTLGVAKVIDNPY